MKALWPKRKLADFIQQRKDSILLEDKKEYHRVTVHLHAKGIELRDVIRGEAIKTKKQFIVRTNDLLVAEIDAKVGGYGIVPSGLEGSIVSSHYFLYEVDQSKINIRFLEYWLKTPSPLEQIQLFIRGALNYAAIRSYHFPEITILLPSLAEQQRIVEKIDQIAARAEEAKRLENEVEKELTFLLLRSVEELSKNAPRMHIRKVAPVLRRPIEIKPDAWYPELGIRSFGKGTFHKKPVKGSELGNKRLFQIEPGDLLLSNVFSWEGAIAVVQHADRGRFGSHRFITCVPDPKHSTAEFLCHWFLSEKGLADIRAASPGAAGRNKTLGIKKLEAIEVPLPPIEKQQEFSELVKKVKQTRIIHQEKAVSLEHFMPALLDQAFRGEL